MVRIRACRVRDRGSIPRRGVFFFEVIQRSFDFLHALCKNNRCI